MDIVKKTMARLLAMLVLTGCVSDRPDDCPPCRLTFHYTLHTSGSDAVASNMRSIVIYIFDTSTGVLASVAEVGKDDILRGSLDLSDLPDGVYTFVAWGASGDDFSRSYMARHMTDPATHAHTDVRVGETTVDTFYMMLEYEAPDGVGEYIVPSHDAFDNLFHAVARDIAVTRSGGGKVEFDFVRNTSNLHITVTGLEHLAGQGSSSTRAAAPLSLYAVGRNGRYRWDNTIDPHARRMLYSPVNHALTPTSLSTDITIQRLDLSRHTGRDGDPVLLYLQDGEGRNIMRPLNIVGALGQILDSSGVPRYSSQESIDREEEFRFAIALAPSGNGNGGGGNGNGDVIGIIGIGVDEPLSVSITVNDWELILLDPVQ